jgi:hypothetical protein
MSFIANCLITTVYGVCLGAGVAIGFALVGRAALKMNTKPQPSSA